MVFDDDMRASARTLANHALMDGGVNAGGGGVGGSGGRGRWGGRRSLGGGGAGLQGMGALRESLVSQMGLKYAWRLEVYRGVFGLMMRYSKLMCC